MCNTNQNTIVEIDFSTVNDEFNWLNNTTTPIETTAGKLVLKPESENSEFRRGLGTLDLANNRILLKINLELLRKQTSTQESMCVLISIYVGATLIDEFSIFNNSLVTSEIAEYFFERVYYYQNVSGNVSMRIKTPIGYQNELYLKTLKCYDFKFCEDNVRTYFAIENVIDLSLNSISSGFQFRKYEVDGNETLTSAFFTENNSVGGNPLNDWFFALAKKDGSERTSNTQDPNTFNPFISELGLIYDAAEFYKGKPTGTINGSDYGEGILNLGFDKPEILNNSLETRKGVFFIDIDYTKHLKIVFDFIVNNFNTNVFNSPVIYREYTIEWDPTKCQKKYYFKDYLKNNELTDIEKDGFLSGLTGFENTQNIIGCNESFNYNGESGVFEMLIDFGTGTGQTGISYNASNVPDKFEIEWNGQFFNSGYVGLNTWDNALINEGVLPSEINTGNPSTGNGTLFFNKNNSQPNIATIRVYAPLENTTWSISGICPQGQVATLVEVGEGVCATTPSLWQNVYVMAASVNGYQPQNGDVLYLDMNLTTVFDGGNKTYKMRLSNPPFQTIIDAQFDVDNQGIISNYTQCSSKPVIEVISTSESQCTSCFIITIDVPQGEQRKVSFNSNFELTGVYSTTCIGQVDSTFVTADFNDSQITQATTYVFGIDSNQDPTTQQEISQINVIVKDSNDVVLEQQSFERLHSNSICE